MFELLKDLFQIAKIFSLSLLAFLAVISGVGLIGLLIYDIVKTKTEQIKRIVNKIFKRSL